LNAAGNSDADAADLPSASVVVAVYNAAATLRACIDSLVQLDYPRGRLELLCVDNASTDASARILAGYGDRLTVLRESRRGPAAARNCGLRACRGEVAAFTDADCIVDPAWLRALIGPLAEPRVGVVGGKILSRRPANAVERFGERIHDHERALTMQNPPYAITMNWASRRSVIEAVGLFNDELPRCSDVDLSYRMLQQGYRLAYAPAAIVYHRNERTPWGLMCEGYVHGYHAVKVLALHAQFIDRMRVAAATARAAGSGMRRAAPHAGSAWPDRFWWALFNLGKRIGRLHASLATAHATR